MKWKLLSVLFTVLLLTIVFGGCFEENNKEGNGGVAPLSGKVTITTNKSEYEQNEPINFTVTNGLKVSIYSYAAGSPNPFFIELLEKKTFDGWESFLTYCPDFLYELVFRGEIKSGESVSFEWEPSFWINGTWNFSKLEPGYYRIKTSYNVSDDNTWQTIHSNEFTINEENKSQDNQTDYWAFCIGTSIDDYGLTVKNILVENGWQENHIKILHGDDHNLSKQDFLDGMLWLDNNDDSNDISLIFTYCDGSSDGLAYLGGVKHDELGSWIDELDSQGIAVIISACYSGNAIPYLQKEGRVIITTCKAGVTSIGGLGRQINQGLAGMGDYIGDQNGIVSAEEVHAFMCASLTHNLTEYYRCGNQDDQVPQMQDDYEGPLNLLYLPLDDTMVDQKQLYYFDTAKAVGHIVGNEPGWTVDYNLSVAQSFIPSKTYLSKVKLIVFRGLGEDASLTVSIRKNLSGDDLTSVSLPGNQIQALTTPLIEFDFEDITVSTGETYYIVCRVDSEDYSLFTLNVQETDDFYSHGELYEYSDLTSVWAPSRNVVDHSSFDLVFITYGYNYQ